MIKKYLFLSIFYVMSVLAAPSDTFHGSFIASYDLSGRYTHEYHPFILKKTNESFLKLEQSLREAQFSVDGRVLIVGYQEDAVPPYMTQWSRAAIDDEVIVRTTAGIAQPTRNIFGYMTGFLLKDAEWLERFWYKNTYRSYVSHILAHPIALFDDKAVIFQKHAFGKDYPLLLEARNDVEKALYKKDSKGVLGELIDFWALLYKRASTTGSQEIVGTQDMLFSIDYAKALKEGKAPIRKIFVGPDITYPIEVLSCQKEKATAHAQEFIRVFQEEVCPINDQNTAYIFCSFVDGVGKSTLLNNIKNWAKYANQFDLYERCDNSSSQEASVYKLRDKVFLVDLPAQISHFTSKPDGSVFVDIETTKNGALASKEELVDYIGLHKEELIEQATTLKESIAQEDKALYEDPDPIRQYLLNCHVMNNRENEWIPLKFQDHYYLFNKSQPSKVRILVPIAGVHSMGLKVVEPEQMLFSQGLALPMSYESFLADLKNKLSQAGVKRVVFIDFLSMYPRSSRENIRLNFILQYLKKIFGDAYMLQESFYRHHIYKEQEICHLLYTKLPKVTNMLVLETAMRWALYQILESRTADTLTSLSGVALESKLKEGVKAIMDRDFSMLYEASKERLEPEQAMYYQNYGLDRIYENLVRFSMTPILLFNTILTTLFTKGLKVPYCNALWEGMEGVFTPIITPAGKVQVRGELDNSTPYEVRYIVHKNCCEPNGLKDIIQGVKAQWYALISTLLFLGVSDNEYQLSKLEHYVPPLVLRPGLTNYIFAVQKKLPLIEPASLTNVQLPAKYNVVNLPNKPHRWGLFADAPHYMDWGNTPGTFLGIYAYGYNPFKNPRNIITRLVDEYQRDAKPQWGMSTAELCNRLIQRGLMPRVKQEIHDQWQGKLSEIKPEQVPLVQLWIRMIATLDMILKDVRSMVFVRKGNKKDFEVAVQLLEAVTLPLYFGLESKVPLFTDYQAVEPVISWDKILAE